MTRAFVATVLLCGCGARSDLRIGDEGSIDDDDDHHPSEDAGLDAGQDANPPGDCVPVEDGCRESETCGNGADDDCDGDVDEACSCSPGAVQACFPGPPGRRDIGVCTDGAQTCEGSRRWGPCEGAIVPREDVCNGSDNLCTGCSERRDCPIDCPSADDPRVPEGAPFEDYALRGPDFYQGPVQAWRWSVRGGPCDELAPNLVSFDLENGSSANARLVPRLSGDYTVTLQVTTKKGTILSCEWVVHVAGPGLRVEMCYPESLEQDLDLFLHRPGSAEQWYADASSAFNEPGNDVCGWHNCEATIRGTDSSCDPIPRADWGYASSSLDECRNGPQGSQWEDLGYCANPRLDIDNNLSKGSGLPENINVDAPRDGETFRIMVQNFSGDLAKPIVNVYCAGRRVATYGASPDVVPDFEGTAGFYGIGAMWRVADVTIEADSEGETVGCASEGLHPPGQSDGYDVTYDDPRY